MTKRVVARMSGYGGGVSITDSGNDPLRRSLKKYIRDGQFEVGTEEDNLTPVKTASAEAVYNELMAADTTEASDEAYKKHGIDHNSFREGWTKEQWITEIDLQLQRKT